MRRKGPSVRIWSFPLSEEIVSWLLLPLLFLLGGVLGHILAGADIPSLDTILTDYADPNRRITAQMLPELLWKDARPIGLAILLSCSAVGVIGLPLLFSLRGFLAAYTISALSGAWGYPGWILSALWVGGRNLLLTAALLLISVPGWALSCHILTDGRISRRSRDFQSGVLLSLLGLVLLVLYEYLVWNMATAPVLIGQIQTP